MSNVTVTQTGGAANAAVTVSRGLQGAAGPNSVTTSTSSNLTGYISANGTAVSGATAGTTASTPDTLVLRDGYGGGVYFTSSDVESTTVSITNTGTTDNNYPVALYVAATGNGAGVGANIISNNNTALMVSSTSGTGATINSVSGQHLNIGNSKLVVANNGNTTFTGALSFTSTTRPTSGGTGTPAATSLITTADGDARYGGPFYDLDGSASHSESAATTPVKTVVLPVGTYLIECAKLHAVHTDTTSRTVSITVNFTGGTATMQDRGIQSHPQSGNIIALTYSGQGATLAQSIAITNGSPSFGAGAHYFTGRIVVTAETTLRIFGFCSVTPTNPITYETSGILRKIA